MPANYVLLERIELNASAASVTFSNIPQSGYTDLKIVSSTREADQNFFLAQFNGDTTTSNYSSRFVRGNGVSAASASSSVALRIGVSPLAGSASTVFSNNECYIPNYTGNQQKSVSVDFTDENNGTANYMGFNAGLWTGTAAISSIKIFSETGQSFVSGSTFSLYGLAATGTTPLIAPYAIGGNTVTNDGTYWYHAFLTSGTFTPQKALTCDALVIAGGGGGGEGGSGGGGGAGGLIYSSSQSLTLNTNYTVTVGAGGAAQTSGANSQFSSLTAAIGGGNGGLGGQNGGNGGSGGGSTGGQTKTGGLGTSGQGNNGGDTTFTSPYSGAGGGGAGAAGQSFPNADNTAGKGGVGLSTYSSWGVATKTGENVSGTYYYAGGGGGARNTVHGGTAGAGGYGGGGGGGTTGDGTPGIANTGGGAGGRAASGSNTTANGGSGIVIIRYAI